MEGISGHAALQRACAGRGRAARTCISTPQKKMTFRITGALRPALNPAGPTPWISSRMQALPSEDQIQTLLCTQLRARSDQGTKPLEDGCSARLQMGGPKVDRFCGRRLYPRGLWPSAWPAPPPALAGREGIPASRHNPAG